MPNNKFNAIIGQKIEVAPGLIIIRIVPDGWELPDFKPGQFTVVGLPGSAPRTQFSNPETEPANSDKLIKRAYSIASSSIDKQYIEFYVRLVTSGALTPRLFALKVGDRIWLSPKFTGMFTMNEIPEDKNIILFATGTGVAPYMSMMRSIMISDENRKFAVVHGAGNSWDLGYHSELLTMARLTANFNYFPIISNLDKEAIKWKGLSGFVSKIWEDKLIQEKWGIEITPDNSRIFLCGNPQMVMGMLELLGKDNFQEHKKSNPGNIHLERFW